MVGEDGNVPDAVRSAVRLFFTGDDPLQGGEIGERTGCGCILVAVGEEGVPEVPLQQELVLPALVAG
ncbi:hypothetical protein FGU65_14160 [Methanoculleus sp. FWC-SCC1]|uniref:Uncharacterized protein n=1 Tax=Methanoculleus frigidifontis TaxID=2584085 RepID=A0ABT8MDK0_9EURY|nr:hypothetical protein [Methanoculleus sp. FWC-SCC1]MDN7026013.1 hypothetical protein [Methanoculleus sp. FWC-SCC1]